MKKELKVKEEMKMEKDKILELVDNQMISALLELLKSNEHKTILKVVELWLMYRAGLK